ncbi:Rrf2 family transcriptional regulator [Virgibacillus soli]|uniref:HTH-type transcriptional regulator NsrR n=1 Tax=Paracerasibacillus soli TaxID=480284 RepID=A0ABU5CMM6_9BACI|nr:Rrf2 family transcriptional regulator [Virgibacillus soli]MDY0407632.1 Rrf2 family transcriptional regulator [Virgibacillus soli]
MQLKKYTDYALRVLIFTGMKSGDDLASIKEISEVYAISQHHLGKIVFELNKLGLIETVRGRYGGIRLAKQPEDINVGAVVRDLENDFYLLECFNKHSNHCIISPACKLKHVLHEALEAFFHVLDQYTLKDLIVNENELLELMGL